MQIRHLIVVLFAGCLLCPAANACEYLRPIIMHWNNKPADLASDEVVLVVNFLGDSTRIPSTMSSTLLHFRVSSTEEESPFIDRDDLVMTVFEARCRSLFLTPFEDEPQMVVGRILPRPGQTPLFEPRYQDCLREADIDGRNKYVCGASFEIELARTP